LTGGRWPSTRSAHEVDLQTAGWWRQHVAEAPSREPVRADGRGGRLQVSSLTLPGASGGTMILASVLSAKLPMKVGRPAQQISLSTL